MLDHCKLTRIGHGALRIWTISLILALLTGIMDSSPALAAGPIVLDGQFTDWDGQAKVDDPQGDALNERTDIKAFYFATNPDDETAYFMVERWENKLLEVNYVLRVDTNNNGDYTEAVDRRVTINYDPSPHGYADVDLYDGTGGFIRTIANNAPWGETQKGARVEWGVPFTDLGIAPFQTIRMTLVSMQGKKVSDEVAEVQWSPANALGKVALAVLALGGLGVVIPAQEKEGMAPALTITLFLAWLITVLFLRHYRVWLLYYLVGAVGFAYWFILIFGSVLGFDSILAHSVAWTVHFLSNLISIPTRIFEGSPGLLLVMVIAQKVGWQLQVGVESSGLLEIGVMTSLLLFYPGWSTSRRIGLIVLGGLAIWLANIVRMMVIVIMLNRFGKEALVLAHMYVGKAVFFLLAVCIFWLLITVVTLKDLEKGRLVSRAAS